MADEQKDWRIEGSGASTVEKLLTLGYVGFDCLAASALGLVVLADCMLVLADYFALVADYMAEADALVADYMAEVVVRRCKEVVAGLQRPYVAEK